MQSGVHTPIIKPGVQVSATCGKSKYNIKLNVDVIIKAHDMGRAKSAGT